MTTHLTPTTLAELSGLPPTLTPVQAGALLGLGRSATYRLLREGAFPVPPLPVPGRRKIATAAVLELLGIPVTALTDPADTDREALHQDFTESLEVQARVERR